MRKLTAASILVVLLSGHALAAPAIDPISVNIAIPGQAVDPGSIDPLIVRAQVLLDRAHFSPGEIDGLLGENVQKAIVAFASANGMTLDGTLTAELWQKLSETSHDPVTKDYAIEDKDIAGPFLPKLPPKMEMMKDLPALSYTSASEGIAEKFHMSEDLLAALNPTTNFADAKAGATIVVANVTNEKRAEKASRVEVDKTAQTVKVFGADNDLLAFFPATVGSEEKPAPSGSLKIVSVSKNPTYTYNPDYKFKGVKSQKPFEIKPGPNNPVGLVWVGLSDKGYGIHGTPNPATVSKTASHGCVRLTNWDAEQLAGMVKRGLQVTFEGSGDIARSSRSR